MAIRAARGDVLSSSNTTLDARDLSKSIRARLAWTLVVSALALLIIVGMFGMVTFALTNPPPTQFTAEKLKQIGTPGATTTNYLNAELALNTNKTTDWTFKDGFLTTTTGGQYLIVDGGALKLAKDATIGSLWRFDGTKFINVSTNKALTASGSGVGLTDITETTPTNEQLITIDQAYAFTKQYEAWWWKLACGLGIGVTVVAFVTILAIVGQSYTYNEKIRAKAIPKQNK